MSIPALADCRPGLRATGFALIVAIEPVSETQRGIFIPDNVREKERLVTVRGRIVSMSPACFDFAQFPPGTAPKVGDAVHFAKLAGVMITGADDREYRVLQDRDVYATIDEETE